VSIPSSNFLNFNGLQLVLLIWKSCSLFPRWQHIIEEEIGHIGERKYLKLVPDDLNLIYNFVGYFPMISFDLEEGMLKSVGMKIYQRRNK
jgi:hypothetical protein